LELLEHASSYDAVQWLGVSWDCMEMTDYVQCNPQTMELK